MIRLNSLTPHLTKAPKVNVSTPALSDGRTLKHEITSAVVMLTLETSRDTFNKLDILSSI